jgi:hypothetical protein
MRKDMKKVIIDRGRLGTAAKRNRSCNKINIHDLDENGDYDPQYPSKISPMKEAQFVEGYDTKQQAELMGPVLKYLRKQVGRLWDDVWSEICENNKDFMGDHLKRHIQWEVSTKTYMEDGQIMCGEIHYPIRDSWGRSQFYVHPETEILCVTKDSSKKNYSSQFKYKILEMDGQEYYKDDDIWYRVKTAKFQEGVLRHDVFGGTAGYWGRDSNIGHNLKRKYGKAVVCYWKQQANSKECKKLKEME